MITFFRKIRQNLLLENKISKYFKYAIGEILLVVVGILIALQINNWNQLRLNKQEAYYLKKSLLNDLEKDSMILARSIKMYTVLSKKNKQLIDQCNKNTANVDTIKAAAANFEPTFLALSSFNTGTLNAIESSAKLDLFDENLRIQLFQYKQVVMENLKHVNENIYLSKVNLFQAKYPFGEIKSSYLKRLNKTIENEREYANLFTALIGYKEFMMSVSLSNWNNTLNLNKKLAKLIKSSIEND